MKVNLRPKWLKHAKGLPKQALDLKEEKEDKIRQVKREFSRMEDKQTNEQTDTSNGKLMNPNQRGWGMNTISREKPNKS